MSESTKVIKSGDNVNVGSGDKASSKTSLPSDSRLRGSVGGMSKSSLEAESRRRSSLVGIASETKTMALGEISVVTAGSGERDRRKRTSGGVMFAADTVQRERGSGSITQNFARRRSTLNVQQTIEAFKDRMVSETSVA
jgi:hypothetical protein